jgi:hypothetical protein
MLVDAIPGATGDLAHDDPQTCVVDLARPTAARTDDVVVMRALAHDVGVFTGRQVQAFHGAELFEDLQRPEDRRAPDPESLCPGIGQEVSGGEMGVAVPDQRGKPAARFGQPITGAIEDGDDWGWFHAGKGYHN